MKKKLLNFKSIDRICANCANGRHAPDGDSVLCTEKGVMNSFSTCRKFKYDPLNRIPKQKLPKSLHTAEEFEL